MFIFIWKQKENFLVSCLVNKFNLLHKSTGRWMFYLYQALSKVSEKVHYIILKIVYFKWKVQDGSFTLGLKKLIPSHLIHDLSHSKPDVLTFYRKFQNYAEQFVSVLSTRVASRGIFLSAFFFVPYLFSISCNFVVRTKRYQGSKLKTSSDCLYELFCVDQSISHTVPPTLVSSSCNQLLAYMCFSLENWIS